MDGRYRKNIPLGARVAVIQKHHQRTGEETQGIVKRILTKLAQHPHGIKVLLDDGTVGRVSKIFEN